MATFEGHVHGSKLSNLKAEVEKINKKAKKLGLEPMVIEVGERVVERREDEFGFYTIAYYPVKITGEAPQIAGWHLVAVLNHVTDEGNFVRVVPGETLPEVFRDHPQNCDHCGHNRYRKDTFVVQHEDGTYKQVGSACVADFLGHKNPKSLLYWASIPAKLSGIMDECGIPMSGYHADYDLLSFLAWTNATISKYGWMSAGKAREEEKEPTYSMVIDQMDPKFRARQKEKEFLVYTTDEDFEVAAEAIEWAKNVETKNDYLHNVRLVANSEMVNSKTFGVTASIIPSFKRATAVKVEKNYENKPSDFFGEVGKKYSLTLKLLSRFEFEGTRYGYYDTGTVYIYKFVDENTGNIFVWKTSNGAPIKEPHLRSIERFETVEVTGKVKKHQDYKGTKQTLLSHCRVSEIKK